MQKEEFFDIVNHKTALSVENTKELEKIAGEFPYFHVAQIVYLKNLKETSNPEFGTVLKKVAVSVPDRKRLYRFLNARHELVADKREIQAETENLPVFNLEYNEESPSKNALIDKFLSSDLGKISRNPEAENNLERDENEVIKKSVEEDDEIVTETLAGIYFQQKKYDKALHAFRKLSLKYPEKSVYFASRIEEIEKVKNI
jgi:tetratricopeptide (TPR) repeat protein